MRFTHLIAVLAMLATIAVYSNTQAEEKNPFAPKMSGEVEGVVKEKGKSFIRVAIEGREGTVRFTPEWSGGLPKDGGGLDKKVLKKIRAVKPGSTVKIKWKYSERPRVLDLETIKKNDEQ